MKITIETIPHRTQRIPGQIGDWQWLAEDELLVRVSELGDWQHNAALAVHELVEALLCFNDDVSQARVDRFDMGHFGVGEPGDARDAPYARQHCFATAVERMLIAAMGRSWADYDRAVEALP